MFHRRGGRVFIVPFVQDLSRPLVPRVYTTLVHNLILDSCVEVIHVTLPVFGHNVVQLVGRLLRMGHAASSLFGACHACL